jgi:hypothetical protein
MPEGGSLVNLGELSKPATVLIEKISDAIGGIAKPWQIKRIANAESEAAKIKALARMEVTAIEDRAIARMIRQEGMRQQNIEDIAASAIPHLANDAKPEEIADDWLTQFFEKSRLVSDQEMQQIWSKILAAEANKANSFRKKTINLVSTLEKSDANLFTKLCSFVWMFYTPEVVYFYTEEFPDFDFKKYVTDLLHLEDIGLIKFETQSEFIFKLFGKSLVSHYYGTKILIDSGVEQGGVVKRGNVSLTQAGRELFRISGSTPNVQYVEAVLRYWQSAGHLVSTPITSKSRWIALGTDSTK